MGRPRFVTVLSPAKTRADAVRDVWAGIDQLILLANQHDEASHADAEKVRAVLTLLSEGKRVVPIGWPAAASVYFHNLTQWVLLGGLHVRRCDACSDWFRTNHGNCRLCKRCQRKAAARRQAKKRRLEQERQREARKLSSR